MGSYASNLPISDSETRDLQQLLDAFASTASLQEITSAYCKGGRNIQTAFEILLSNREGSTSGTSSLSSKDERDEQNEFSNLSNEFMEKASLETNTIATNQKKGSVSMGTVVDVIGKEYARPKPSRSEFVEGNKPPKVNVEEFPVYEDTPTLEIMHRDTEDFLFKMLGDGFQLDRNVIQEVLGHCGYDVGTSMNKLLDISASTLQRSGDSFNLTAEEPPKISLDACEESAGRLVPEPKLAKSNKDRHELEKDLVQALFTVPQRIEETPKQNGLPKACRKPRAFGKIVSEPFIDTLAELKTPVVTLLGRDEENEEDEDGYQILRKAVMEYWTTMKEYYKAAVDAFTRGDHERAEKLVKEGHFFMGKAREADEKSAQKFLEPRKEVMSLDLHEYEPIDAIRFLKIQFKSLSGIAAIPLLKIIVGGDTEEPKDGTRKRRRQIKKFLEKESIKWTEERDGRTLVIKFEEIDRKNLSFAKK